MNIKNEIFGFFYMINEYYFIINFAAFARQYLLKKNFENKRIEYKLREKKTDFRSFSINLYYLLRQFITILLRFIELPMNILCQILECCLAGISCEVHCFSYLETHFLSLEIYLSYFFFSF